jgi:hypothetical protein
MDIKDQEMYEKICGEIASSTPISFSRWGDGEWFNIEKRPGSNCDGNIYYPDLGDALKAVASVKQPYYMGKQKATGCYSAADDFDQDWIHSDIFHWASIEGQLDLLWNSLKDPFVVYIGNDDLKTLPFINGFINIPPNNVWLQRDKLMEIIKGTIKDRHTTYLFSAGMATNVFIDELYRFNSENSYIDVGSVFDPYVGKCTRSYHRNLKIGGSK